MINRLSPQSKKRLAKETKNLDEKEKIIKTIKLIADDFYLYAERNLVIKDKDGALIPLEHNWAQKKLVDHVMECLVKNQPIRILILKARQMGMSTIVEAMAYWWTATHKNVTTVITAHEKDAATNIYKMFKRYYDHTHDYWKPATKYHTKNDLTFNNDQSTGLNSTIKTTVADEGAGRSDTIQFLHGSEVALWNNGYDIMAGLLQAVPLRPNTFIFLESTANGTGGYFYDQWQLAKKGDSVFTPFFFSWHEHDEYEIEGKIDVYTKDEEELLIIFKEKKYPKKTWDHKLNWRRYKMKEMKRRPGSGGSAEDLFRQEYPSNDVEAFLASGRPVFDLKVLMEMEVESDKHPPTYYLLTENARKITPKIVDDSPLKVWDLPQSGKKYTIAVDVSEGLAKNDYSVIDVMDDNLKTVARWRGHTDPDHLGEEAKLLGYWYNNALLAVESNAVGLTTLTYLRDNYYRNLYKREKGRDEWFEEPTAKLGWRTDRKTKPLAINDLLAAIRERQIIDYDPVFARECMTYVRDDRGSTNAQEGTFDDTVMAKAINLQMHQWQDYGKKGAAYKPKRKTKRVANRKRKG